MKVKRAIQRATEIVVGSVAAVALLLFGLVFIAVTCSVRVVFKLIELVFWVPYSAARVVANGAQSLLRSFVEGYDKSVSKRREVDQVLGEVSRTEQ